jgi:hypothetical protein
MLIPQSVSYATSLAKMSPVTGLVSQLAHYVRKLLYPLITRRTAHLGCLMTVFCINTPDCVCTPWFLQAVERCTGGCPQSTRRPDRHVCITIRSPLSSSRPKSCEFCRRHSNNRAGPYILLIVNLLFAHVILGRVDFLFVRFLSPRFHRRCPVSRTPSRICHGGCMYYTHVSARNCSHGPPDSPLLK